MSKEKINHKSPEWEKLANKLARSANPPILPCLKCGYPYIHGYICSNCFPDED